MSHHPVFGAEAGAEPSRSPGGAGDGGGTLQVVCGHPQMEAPQVQAEHGTRESASHLPALFLTHRHSAQQPLLPGKGPRVWQKGHRLRRPPRRGASPSPSQPHPSCVTQALSEPVSSSRLRTSRAALAGTAGSLDHRHRPGGRSRRTPQDEAVRVQRCSGHGVPHCLPPPGIPGLPRQPPGPTAPALVPRVPVFSPHYPLLSPLSCQSKSGLPRGGPRCSLVLAIRRRHEAQHQVPGLLGGA